MQAHRKGKRGRASRSGRTSFLSDFYPFNYLFRGLGKFSYTELSESGTDSLHGEEIVEDGGYDENLPNFMTMTAEEREAFDQNEFWQ